MHRPQGGRHPTVEKALVPHAGAMVDEPAVQIPTGVHLRSGLMSMLMTDREIRRLVLESELARLHRGAYVAGPSPLDSGARYAARVEALVRSHEGTGDRLVLAGPAALTRYGLPLFGRPPEQIHLAKRRTGGRAARGMTVAIGELPVDERRTVAGIEVASPARAALDTARLHTLVAGLAAADAGLRTGLMSMRDLTVSADRMPRLKGVERARRVTDLAHAGSQSPGESWSALVLDQVGVPRPQRQAEFRDGRGLAGRVDFWWPEHRTVGEFDGRVKYGRRTPWGQLGQDALWAEKLREDRLRDLGLAVVRWTMADLGRPEDLRARIERAFARQH